MSCLICAGPAERIVCQGNWEERNCPDCGHYRVSDSLILMLMEQGQIFDVEKTRSWLGSKKKESPIPSIVVVDGLLLPDA
jgi:hypothetical protein